MKPLLSKTGADQPCGLTHAELIIAGRNFGLDLSCGACAAQFYTGYGGYQHDDTCTTEHLTRLGHRALRAIDAYLEGDEDRVAELDDFMDIVREFRKIGA